MRNIVLFLIFGYSAWLRAEGQIIVLDPPFNEAVKVEFSSSESDRGQTLRGSLIAKGGKRYAIPDTCEPEGGEAELTDAFTVKGREVYFLFTCVWAVQHSGLGLSGKQYETFVYSGSDLASIGNMKLLSQSLSAYEGSLEEGGNSYSWYTQRKLAAEKIAEVEAGRKIDSIALAHNVVLVRLKDMDYDAIKSYLNPGRLLQLQVDYPLSASTVVAYNDFGYALAQAGEYDSSYKLLAEIEKNFPSRVVLKLNIADVLWETDRARSAAYYKEYVDLMQKSGKAKNIPKKALERSQEK